MEAERKSMLLQGDAAAVAILPFHEKITYKVGNKVNHDSELIRSAESPYLAHTPWIFSHFFFFIVSFFIKYCYDYKNIYVIMASFK